MTIQTVSQENNSPKKQKNLKAIRRHEQFCLGVLTIAQNGAYEEDLLPLIERMHEQAEELSTGMITL